jgi:sec-independent protein translocase protein TatB
MFDLGWSELAFLAVLALIVVGPKDLPKLIHGAGRLAGRAQRFYRESMFSLRRLENEIDIASARKDGKPAYFDLLPEHVRALVATETDSAPAERAQAAATQAKPGAAGAESGHER